MELTKLNKHLPNLLTFSNMSIGIIVIFMMIDNPSLDRKRLSCYLIYLAAIFDFLDGLLARHLNVVSDMGKQLDSFADLITFGIAPVAIFISNLNYISWFIGFLLLLYPLAGSFRLARYNLQEDCGYFIGLPITASGFITATVLLINSYLQIKFTQGFVAFYLLLTLTLSIMMVSDFRVNRLSKSKNVQ